MAEEDSLNWGGSWRQRGLWQHSQVFTAVIFIDLRCPSSTCIAFHGLASFSPSSSLQSSDIDYHRLFWERSFLGISCNNHLRNHRIAITLYQVNSWAQLFSIVFFMTKMTKWLCRAVLFTTTRCALRGIWVTSWATKATNGFVTSRLDGNDPRWCTRIHPTHTPALPVQGKHGRTLWHSF